MSREPCNFRRKVMYTDLLDKGYACLRRGDPEAALSRFRHAVECHPERPQAYFATAIAYIEQGSDDAVKTSLEAVLGVDAAYDPTRSYLGIELLKRNDVQASQQQLDQPL